MSKKETVSAIFTANVNRVAILASQIVTKGGFRMSDETLGSLCLENYARPVTKELGLSSTHPLSP